MSSQVHAEIVSDAIVRTRTTETQYHAGPLVWELIDLLHIQIDCLSNDILVQRRVKIWRGDIARSLVFGPDGDAQPQMTSDALRNLEAARVRGHLQPTEPEIEKGGHSQEQMVEATT